MKKFKLLKIIIIPYLWLTTFVTFTIGSIGCASKNNVNVNVSGISLNKFSMVLSIGESYKLSHTIVPENATNKSVTWTSNNPNIVKVNNNGVINTISCGESNITVISNNGHKKATCEVKVIRDVIHVKGITFDIDSMNLQLNNTTTLMPKITPIIATDTLVIWSSSNPSIATVDQNGLITPIDDGFTTIIATTNDGNYTATCKVRVYGFELKNCLMITANTENSSVKFYQDYDESINRPNLSYSNDDGKTWNIMELNQTIPIDSGEKLYLKGNNPNGWTIYDLDQFVQFGNFLIEGNVSLSGSIMALLDDGIKLIDAVPSDYCFYKLFNDCIGIKEIPNDFLPATELTNNCYDSMFYNCSSLTEAPDLPAENLVNNCYSHMFYNCKSLTKAPDLPAIELADFCYYSMFSGCESLTKAPDLPATELVNNCYASMFYRCSLLSRIKIYYEGKYDSNYFSNWVSLVASNGIFYYNGTDLITKFGFPRNWSKHSFS